MVRLKKLAILVVAAAAGAMAQPALTTIQDVLYRADGTRYNGTVFIKWSSFQAADTSNIATASLTVPVVNGVLKVKLVPTTTATAGAQYNVTYDNTQGTALFREAWAVPPSTGTLRVRDVRVSTGSIVGPGQISSSPIQIGDVVGLSNALSVLPPEGVGYAPNHAAVINSAGMLEGATGSPSDCVRVDGSSGPCGGGGGVSYVYSDNETPGGGFVDGSNVNFTLLNAPSPIASLYVYRNGVLQTVGVDYTITGTALRFYSSSTPQTGDILTATYRYADPTNPFSSFTSPQVICASNGTAPTSATSAVTLGTCTIPGGLLHTGDRIEAHFQYSHTGTGTGFTPSVLWGGTTILSRAAAATDSGVAGKLSFAITSGAQPYNAQSWGSSLPFAASVGSATENSGIALTISFNAAMAGTTTDAAVLSNFTVTRYTAQTNP
jgi:hypothetical protein